MYLIAETSEVTHQFVNPPLDRLRIWAMAAFLVFHSIVENLPHHSAELVSHGPDGFLVSELGYQPAIQVLENAALGFDGSTSCLIEKCAAFDGCPWVSGHCETAALCSRPGQHPTQEASWPEESKLAACGPTSAMICCAESTPRPGV